MITVLIADDSLFMRAYLKQQLVQHGFKVVAEAKNGVEAVKLFKLHEPDLVILDITMPIKNGIDALKEIKASCIKTHIIMCSALGQKQMILEALSIGATDFVVKPHFHNLIPSVKNAFQSI